MKLAHMLRDILLEITTTGSISGMVIQDSPDFSYKDHLLVYRNDLLWALVDVPVELRDLYSRMRKFIHTWNTQAGIYKDLLPYLPDTTEGRSLINEYISSNCRCDAVDNAVAEIEKIIR